MTAPVRVAARASRSANIPSSVVGRRGACTDDRWPAIIAALAALREAGRHSVRIVDADCGAGGVLVRAVRHARTIGFTAIEARGIDGVPASIGRARSAAASLHDRAIGMEFVLADMVSALVEEAAMPADIVLWHGGPVPIAQAVAAVGICVIGDPLAAAAAADRQVTA